MVIPYLSSFLFTVVKKFSDTSFKYLVCNVHVGQNLPIAFCVQAMARLKSNKAYNARTKLQKKGQKCN